MPHDNSPQLSPDTAQDYPTQMDAVLEAGSMTGLPFPIVGLGSAGCDADVFVPVLRALPPGTGMAFVLLSVAQTGEQTRLPEILRGLSDMPADFAAAGQRPEPNRIYIAPQGKLVKFVEGIFQLGNIADLHRGETALDIFFESLASAQKERAIAVLLCGGPADAPAGLAAVRAEGGIAMVQESVAVAIGGKLRAALQDTADVVLSAQEIAAEIGRFAELIRTPELQLLAQGNLQAELEPQFSRILGSMRAISGIDFRSYKPPTLRRRLARRMMLRRVETLSKYMGVLQTHPDELRNLQEDMLLNVTRFFRDPAVFDALKTEILPKILDSRPPEQQVRIWVAGCSSGEEVYSIAIVLLECLSNSAMEPGIQIFGTDASDRSIDKARAAVYPESIAAEVSPERLRRFFVKVENGYQVSKRVRDLCIFARQNLCNDPPFSRLDLISCRNVLIYLGAEVQQRIISTFHCALRPNGFLLLGSAESVREHPELFTAQDRKNKFFAKHPMSRNVIPEPVPRFSSGDLKAMITRYSPRDAANEPELERAADRIVLARYAPAGVVINDRLEVVQVRGHTAPFLEMSPGAASLSLLRMTRDGFGNEVREAVRRAINDDVPVVMDNLQVRDGDSITKFMLEVLPVQTGAGRARHFLVMFLPEAHSSALDPAGLTRNAIHERTTNGEIDREVARLSHDLASTRLYLQSLVEERDGRNQELTSAYEELQSANEELQSTNEELETAKEEMQSANEELQTLNEELRNRNLALMHASNDFTNLLNAVNIPVVILSSELTIREYTPPAERLMRVRASDLGRHIGEIRLNLKIENIEPLLSEVLDTLVTKELDVQDQDGRWQLLRIRPYRTSDNKIDGLVMVLLDVDQIRQGEIALREARDFAHAVVEAVRTPIVVLDRELRVRSHNEAFRNISGLGAEDIQRRSFPEFAELRWGISELRPRLVAMLDAVAPNLDVEYDAPGNPVRVLRLNGCCVFDQSEPWLLLMIEDITDRKLAERFLETERDRLSGQVHSTAEALDSTQHELRALAARLFQTQEDERRRVARELHDDIGQKLALLEIETERFRQNFPEDPELARATLHGLKGRISALSADVRALSHGLHPSVLDDLGLAQALKDLVEEFGKHDSMLATFAKRRVPESIPRPVAAALYRIAQEALRNVAKHAGKTHVKVRLEGGKGGLRLTVRDFGEGFDAGSLEHRGLGLITMEERARLIEGTFSVEAQLGEGTTVTVIAPVPADVEE